MRRLLTRILACLNLVAAAFPAGAADLYVPAPPAAAAARPYACILGAPIEYHRAPRTTTYGTLPSGLAVEILDVPFDPVADLWVRLAAPGSSIYYGWVWTRHLVCV